MKIGIYRSKRGQTALESAIAIILFAIAGIGTWMLYGDAIRHTTDTMISFFESKPH